MPSITVLSLNMQGVGATELAKAITTLKPDLVALQEAPAANHVFYGALKKSILGPAKDYDMAGPVREYPSPPPHIGGSILDAQGAMKQNTILYKKATMTLSQPLALVDFLTDANVTPHPTSVDEARQRGFAARPPAYAEFWHGGQRIGIFTWHAPTINDQAHQASLKHFDKSHALANARTQNHLTILAGDFNDSNLTNYFKPFKHGIQHKFDYILADKATSHDDLSAHGSPYKKALNNLHTTSQDHFAMGVTFHY